MTSKNISISALMETTDVRFGTSGLRGLVEQMNDELCYAYVAAFLHTVVGSLGTDKRVVLGHDLRPSSPGIANACAKAIIDSGMEVLYAGELPTPALASYAYEHALPAIVVTGSHIPFDRNGIKFYKSTGEISKSDELLIQQASVDFPENGAISSINSLVADASVKSHYLKRYIDFFGNANLAGMRVAIYEHSSVARDILREVLEALGVSVISLGRSEDFVPIDTEAVRQEDILQAEEWAKQYSFDAIVSTDGDADRPLISDENGHWLRGDVVGVLSARLLSARVVVTPVSSNTLTEKSAWFNQVVRTKIGSPYVIDAMQASLNTKDSGNNQSVVGFEANGGFLLGSTITLNGKMLNALPTRDAILPILAILSISKQNQQPISRLIETLPHRYTASDRLQNFPVIKSTQLIEKLNKNHQLADSLMSGNSGSVRTVNTVDGFRVTFENGDIVHLRPSGNAPELRCYAESESQKRAQFLCQQCLSKISI
ncbi:phosphomannomutase [Methylotenera sp. L2L1]|uniref:phosphomannomutase n=1 Tax=Methylotenera sp. L2L1 TaxID=1502770 RepID=UPI00055DB7BE|nr:phosphomannomutase [Methylotenera sp. L2L1]